MSSHSFTTTNYLANSTVATKELLSFWKNSHFHAWTKHINVHFHFICQTIHHGHIHVNYITTDNMVADNPCILPYKNEKSLQLSSPISFRLILHLHFSISNYLTSVHVSKAIFQPYRWAYGHLAPLYIMVQWLQFIRTSDMASGSTICPWFPALLFYTLCVASIRPHCSLSRPGYWNPFALATTPQCEVSHCTVSTQHLV